jgi:phenylalanyl-tRNA synthetase alpha chain
MTVQLSDIETQLEILGQESKSAIATANTLEQLEQLRVGYLGKKGQLSQILGMMGKLSPDQRPKVGAIANTVKEALQADLEDKRAALQTAQIQAKLASETIDVTMPGIFRPQGRVHPLNAVIDRALDIFVGLGYTVANGPEMETDYYNFEALNTPPTTQRGICKIHFTCQEATCCGLRHHRCKFATWNSTNRRFGLSLPAAFTAAILLMLLTRQFSTKLNF